MRKKLIRMIAACGGLLIVLGAGEAAADTYTYDALGRLTQVVTSSGVTITYAYDAADNRVTMTVH